MAKKLYLHVGTHKTGTSAIQRFCLYNKELLKTKGYAYPIFIGKYPRITEAHNGFFLTKRIKDKNGNIQMIQEKEVFDECMSQVIDQFKECDNVILSDENMWQKESRREELFTDIKELAEENGFQVVIVVYLRRQDEYMASLWSQRVKVGYWESSTNTWEEWIEEHKNDESLDYAGRITEFTEIFGRENVIVRKYEKTKFKDGDIYSDFLDAIGLQMEDDFCIETKIVNKSLKGNTIEIKRVLNTIPNVGVMEHRFLRELLVPCSDISIREYQAEMFSTEERKAFLENFIEGNSKLAQEFFDEKGELFEYEDCSKEKWEKDNPYMLDAIIRFNGMIALRLYEEKEKLWQENKRILMEIDKIKHPFRHYIGKIVKKLKN